mgnify:CR=1 FL=1
MDSAAGISLLNFNDEDRILLSQAYEIINPDIDRVLDSLYESLDRINSGPDSFGSSNFSLKLKQKSHWVRLFSGCFDEDYENEARKVAVRHVEIGLPHDLFVLSYMKIAVLFCEVIRETPGVDPDRAIRMVEAINKAVAIDMMFAMAPYAGDLV